MIETIRKHINNSLKGELGGQVVVAKFASTTKHGAIEGNIQTHDVNYFFIKWYGIIENALVLIKIAYVRKAHMFKLKGENSYVGIPDINENYRHTKL